MRSKQSKGYMVENFWFLKLKPLWAYFKSESLAFKAISAYMFVEYFRPQSIFPIIDFLPWAQLFLCVALVSVFSDKKADMNWTRLHTVILLFAVSIHLSFLVAFDIDSSKRNYKFFIQWIIVFFLVSSIVTNRERFYSFFLVIFLCSLKIAFGTTRIWVSRGFSFTTWGLTGPPGYFQNSGELAILMLTLFPLGYYLFRYHAKDLNKLEKIVLFLATICPALTILGASSRGAQIALGVQLVIIFWKKLYKPKSLLLLAIVIWLGFNFLPDEQKQRFSEIGEDKTSIQRQLYWKNGWEMMKDHPVLGVGFYNFVPYYNTYYRHDILYSSAQLPHNIFVQIGTDGGFLSLFFYVGILLLSVTYRFPLKQINSVSDKILYAIWKGNRLSIIGFIIAGQFVSVGYYPFLWICLGIQVGITNSIKSRQ
ncbi:O-antigen ligase family protein [Alteromonas sp. S167]|uniref:O-antigen ligase family protein n=1 Tax=Alteromonas sp. S167 TaxID=3117402 RepID=UPI002FDFEF1D